MADTNGTDGGGGTKGKGKGLSGGAGDCTKLWQIIPFYLEKHACFGYLTPFMVSPKVTLKQKQTD